MRNGKSALREEHFIELESGLRTFEDFFDDGIVEYLDVNELGDSIVAAYESSITDGTTHLEIEPFSILGVSAGLIPYAHQNPSSRNTCQCCNAKQAMGTIAYNQRDRMDSVRYDLAYPHRPIVKTHNAELTNIDKLPAGQNAMVAVTNYSGFDLKHGIPFNKASIDRGK